jgi:S1-C subfamily serine protease
MCVSSPGTGPWRVAVVLAGVFLSPAGVQARGSSPFCLGAYANDQVVVAPEARRQEETTRYSFCVRSTAVYQCAYYGPDGSLMSRRQTQSAHGTAFAFRREGAFSYLLTNEHVTEWPFVSSKSSGLDVPVGCKRISQTVSIVDDENDSYAKDDIPLQRVVVDPELDVAVLKAQTRMDIMPFGLGQSSGLQVGDAIRVRGFPLGAFQAVHGGKVISAREPDQEGKWDHYDFVTDAQLSVGNSGSPVMAISCKTRRFELVGIYHAGYHRGQALNTVVGVDEFREIMTTLRPRTRKQPTSELSAADRQALVAELRAGRITPLLPMSGHVIGIRLAGDRLLYDLYPRKFPLIDWRLMVLEDLPSTGFGRVGRIWFGSEQGLRERAFGELRPGEQNAVVHLMEAVRKKQRQGLLFRQLEPLAKRSRANNEKLRALERSMSREQADRSTVLRTLLDVVAQYAPGPNERGVSVSVTAQPPTPAKATAGGKQPAKPAPPGATPAPGKPGAAPVKPAAGKPAAKPAAGTPAAKPKPAPLSGANTARRER